MIAGAGEMITKELYKNFEKLSKELHIPSPLDIRIKIKNRNAGTENPTDLSYMVMNGKVDVAERTLKEILGIGKIDLMGIEKKVKKNLNGVWETLIDQESDILESEETTDVRIAIQIEDGDKKAKIYAFNNGKYFDEILFEAI